jgi:hypothetical protein
MALPFHQVFLRPSFDFMSTNFLFLADGFLLQFPLNLCLCQLLENLLHGLVAHIEPFQNDLRALSPGHGIDPFWWFVQPSFVTGAPEKQKGAPVFFVSRSAGERRNIGASVHSIK